MPQTLNTQLDHFTEFLLAYTHTLLYLRGLYPKESFIRARFHNTPVFQSRHPTVCTWLRDAVAAVHKELLDGTVARIGIVIYWYGGAEKSGRPKILERFMLDVSSFPVLKKEERNMHIGWDGAGNTETNNLEADPNINPGAEKQAIADTKVDVDMSEQFRAALVMLQTRCTRLKPLPEKCSFNLSMELKDDAEVDPPLGHPKPWIPVQPSLQKTGRKGSAKETSRGGEGGDLGGVKVTPIRTVEAGVLRFETWIEEGKAKYELETNNSTGVSG